MIQQKIHSWLKQEHVKSITLYATSLLLLFSLSLAWILKESGVSAILLFLCLGQLIRLILVAYFSEYLHYMPYKGKFLLSIVVVSLLSTSSGWYNNSAQIAALMLVAQPIIFLALLQKLHFVKFNTFYLKNNSQGEDIGRIL